MNCPNCGHDVFGRCGAEPEPGLVTLNQLHENTANVIQELHEKQEPFILTRRGRLLALVTPLPVGVEGALAAEYLKDNPESGVVGNQPKEEKG